MKGLTLEIAPSFVRESIHLLTPSAVRKLVAWQTNKSVVDPSYPAFVLHWTDYSAGRGTPLDREVRTAPTEALMEEIAALLVEDNIKKGWELVA